MILINQAKREAFQAIAVDLLLSKLFFILERIDQIPHHAPDDRRHPLGHVQFCYILSSDHEMS